MTPIVASSPLQGNAEQGARAAQPRQVAAPVLGIVRRIFDLHDRALQRRAADQAVVPGVNASPRTTST